MIDDGRVPIIQSKGMSIKDAEVIACHECKCNYFIPVVKVLKISKLRTGKTKDTLMQVPAMRCSDCGTVLDLE